MIFSNISSIDPGKGLVEFICAVEKLSARDDLVFEIVGRASEVNRPFEESVAESIRRKGLESSIAMKGFIENIGDYLDSVDAVVLSSSTPEALPTVLIEALARGRVIIATDVGGVREIVDESYGNVIVPPAECEALKDAIEKVAGYSKEKREEIGERNIEIAKSKFSLKKQVDEMGRLYMELCRK
ncbi:glycosyl transferase, group 1 [Hydrogenimonas sp.]|nr:glycosyl transferase, group 1 [Hydrogenimonas sp.]